MERARVDDAAWGRLIRRLLDQESGGNRTHFAEAVGVDRKTVTRWLGGVVASEQSIREIARRLGLDPLALLTEVGYLPSASRQTEAREDDDPIAILRRSGLPPSEQRRLAEHLAEETHRLIRLTDRRPRRSRPASYEGEEATS